MGAARPNVEDTPKREAILAAALELFAEFGFHGTAVPLIADKAQVGAGTVYRYFESKEAIVNALYQYWKGEIARVLMTDFPIELPTRQQFHELFRRLTRFAAKHPRVLAFLELHHHAPCLDAESRAAEEAMLVPIRAFIASAQEHQVIKPLDPEVLMPLVWGAAIAVLRASWEGRFALTSEVTNALESCLWEAVRR